MKKEKTIELYKKSNTRKIILKMSQGKEIDKIIQEYFKMAIAEGISIGLKEHEIQTLLYNINLFL